MSGSQSCTFRQKISEETFGGRLISGFGLG